MTYNIECDVKPGFSFHYRELAKKVIDGAVAEEGFPYEAEINLLLTDNAGIHEMNKNFRDIDRPTDVLSFPMLSYDAPGDFESNVADIESTVNPQTGEVLLGDIVISVDKVKEQAAEYGHSEKREFSFLILHSMLHLFGYDHMTSDEAAVMEKKQNLILEQLHIYR